MPAEVPPTPGTEINPSALEPLFAPHEEPTSHRVRGDAGGPAKVVPHRRPTPIAIAQNLRGTVRSWRATDCLGVSDTTRELLHHWFGRDHVLATGSGEKLPFRYYFCQREAIETLIYLSVERSHRLAARVARRDRRWTICAARFFGDTEAKDNAGRVFKHVICDTPLGEAVDAGIVKTPVLGKGKRWADRPSQDASERYQEQLMVGYERWKKSHEEWAPSGKKPLLFVMTEDTEAANQIAQRLNSDPLFERLNGCTINLHTRLKGKVKWIGGRQHGHPEFVENESEISDEDLSALRQLSRDIDSDANPYRCIVSVLMLREGWDVRNVTTIVPLRPYNAPANILPEQTLGRGLRRMTPPAAETTVHEIVTVVEHPAFASLYREQLHQEGLEIIELDAEEVTRTTVPIFPDAAQKGPRGAGDRAAESYRRIPAHS